MGTVEFDDLIKMLEAREKRQELELAKTRSQLEAARKAAGRPSQASTTR